MTNRDSTREEDLLRARLHRLVEDVEPRGDSLPRLLASVRRRRSPRRPFVLAAGAAVAATAVFLVALLNFPGNRGTEPVSMQPNSYVAAARPDSITAFNIVSGKQLGRVAELPGRRVQALATDGEHVYALVSGSRDQLVETSSRGAQQVLADVPPQTNLLAAGGGQVAYASPDAVVVRGGSGERRLLPPRGERVVDVALASDGRLAVLTASDGSRAGTIHLVGPGETSMTSGPAIDPGDECGPLAVTWSGPEVAALRSAGCDSGRVRVTTIDGSGRQIGGGVPFEAGRVEVHDVQLSSDRLGRFLVSVGGGRQWLVDETDVREVPAACAPGGGCADVATTFWS
ncbi:hypothetical protein [Saccharopolyspora taberi]|uniref:FbpC C-terminal regulatory nucleotide binding domain-containing protein n=1 Tax=Saccharopolyspora taberi TaxID=60895 RepID=A0ABN3V3D6_9PSEU